MYDLLHRIFKIMSVCLFNGKTLLFFPICFLLYMKSFCIVLVVGHATSRTMRFRYHVDAFSGFGAEKAVSKELVLSVKAHRLSEKYISRPIIYTQQRHKIYCIRIFRYKKNELNTVIKILLL